MNEFCEILAFVTAVVFMFCIILLEGHKKFVDLLIELYLRYLR